MPAVEAHSRPPLLWSAPAGRVLLAVSLVDGGVCLAWNLKYSPSTRHCYAEQGTGEALPAMAGNAWFPVSEWLRLVSVGQKVVLDPCAVSFCVWKEGRGERGEGGREDGCGIWKCGDCTCKTIARRAVLPWVICLFPLLFLCFNFRLAIPPPTPQDVATLWTATQDALAEGKDFVGNAFDGGHALKCLERNATLAYELSELLEDIKYVWSFDLPQNEEEDWESVCRASVSLWAHAAVNCRP